MKTGDYVIIKDTYFKDHPDLKEFMYNKKERRIYIGVIVKVSDELNICIPFRSNQSKHPIIKKQGIFSIPTKSKPNACLDLTKSLIINDEKYFKILRQEEMNIPFSQKKMVQSKIKSISNKMKKYVNGYKRYYKEQIRTSEKKQDPLYQYSTLQNYHKELGVLDEEYGITIQSD